MKVIKNILAFGLAIIITMVGVEFYLQGAEIQTPMETYIDSEIGPAFIKNKNVTRFNEGFYVGGVNEYGYLGPAYPLEKASDEVRVLLIGDSFVMGMTVFNRHHFARELERQLGESSGREVQALNFGKADFNVGNMYQYYRDFASQFDHDLVLVFIDRGDLIPSGGQGDTALYPKCIVRGDSVTIDYSFRESATYQRYKMIKPISEYSSLFRLTYNAKKMVARGELAGVVLDKFEGVVPEKPRKQKKQRDIQKIATEWTLPILREFGRDPRVILVLAKPVETELYWVLEESGLSVIDLKPVVTGLEDRGVDPYYWKVSGERGHWNHEAHAEIGRYLARELAGRIGDG